MKKVLVDFFFFFNEVCYGVFGQIAQSWRKRASEETAWFRQEEIFKYIQDDEGMLSTASGAQDGSPECSCGVVLRWNWGLKLRLQLWEVCLK